MDTVEHLEPFLPKAEPVELLSVAETAERLTISEQTTWRHIRAGRLPAVRIGGAVRVRSVHADQFEIPYEVRGR
jgi:excisionase family DNA binding protein